MRARHTMEQSFKHVKATLARVRAGRALPSMLDDIFVPYYGDAVPLRQVAAVGTCDVRTLTVKPWEPKLIPEIGKAILTSKLALNPQNDGATIRITLPVLTEERRISLVKQVKVEIEKGRVAMRNARKSAKEAFKQLKKTGLSEDIIRTAEEDVQQLTDAHTARLNELLVQKEKEIMTV